MTSIISSIAPNYQTMIQEKEGKMEEDRISLLPNDILHQILSSMDTQTLIKTTSLLSKRWSNLWTSIPTLLFDFPSFSCPHLNRQRERCFRRFIKRVLSHRRMHLTSLSKVNKITMFFATEPIGCRARGEELTETQRFAKEDQLVFKLLFYFAALNNVEDLSIDGGDLDFSNWCRHFTTCRSLKLSGYYEGIWVPHSFEFLKSLEIENFYTDFFFDEFEDGMLPDYPLLERLILRGSCFEHLDICAPKLEYLELGILSCREYRCGIEISLCTPNLRFVKLDNIVPCLDSTDDFLSLQKVEFSLDYKIPMLDMYEIENEIVEHLRSVFYLLQKANSIVINTVAVEDLSEYVIIPSTLKDESFMFEKLRELRVREGGVCESDIEKSNEILNKLLNNSPSMETWWRGNLDDQQHSEALQINVKNASAVSSNGFYLVALTISSINGLYCHAYKKEGVALVICQADPVLNDGQSGNDDDDGSRQSVLESRKNKLFKLVFSQSNGKSPRSFLDVSTSFNRFMLRALTQHGGEFIQKLIYSYLEFGEESFLTKALPYTPFHKAQQLYITTDYAFESMWSCLSACKLLTVLNGKCFVGSHLESMVLPSLRMFVLDICDDYSDYYDYQVANDQDVYGILLNGNRKTLLSGCPNLEY
ncbi:hypothetical protein Csa_008094 [Cucumis sativus]|nr:hypothetical protein Csa_008094 [Cucumis sativus]